MAMTAFHQDWFRPALFTGKERDAETGLDYFGARYMAAAQGRFTSPDPVNHPSGSKNPAAFLTNPQRWNGYLLCRQQSFADG